MPDLLFHALANYLVTSDAHYEGQEEICYEAQAGLGRLIPLSKNLYTLVDQADFNQLDKMGLWSAFNARGYYYAGRKEQGRLLLLSRWLLKPAPQNVIDHKSGNTLDNRRSNLRELSRGANRRNKHLIQKNNSTGFEGIYFSASQPNPWLAYLTIEGKRVHLGSFPTKLAAIEARLGAVALYFGDDICKTSTLYKDSVKRWLSLRQGAES